MRAVLATLFFLMTSLNAGAEVSPVAAFLQTTDAGVVQVTAHYSCKVRKTCGKMESCAEACYHFRVCGNKRLDRDKDQIPCESLCNTSRCG